ncbi:hypothetical protein GGR53DRAFT_410512 [Hypoxylon sp. FL1150]|nr:hypothetical protein GGR53DRAFT_410512 [Hypoxylon sp. FL1150]
MSRIDLARNRILFFEWLGEYDVPDSVYILHECLLDFFCTVIDRLGIHEEQAFEQPGYIPRILNEAEIIKPYYITKNRALALQRYQDQEQEWADFFYECFFKPVAANFGVTKSDSRWTARSKFYYDSVEYAYDHPWSLFTSQFRFEHRQTTDLTQPTPNLTAYFPIFDTRTSRWPWTKWLKGVMVENFSRETLERLVKHGLHPSATGVFRDGLSPRNSICYPWFIVEHRKDGEQKDSECYCRAANDAAAALMMLRTLAKYSADTDMPPVVTMTTTGEIVRVWIAFFDGRHETYKMICAWKGFMTTIVDIVRLEAILENLHTWATRVLKPWISHCIDQWKSHHPADSILDSRCLNPEAEPFVSQKATVGNDIEDDEDTNDQQGPQRARLESRPRAGSDPFPRPNAAFRTNSVLALNNVLQNDTKNHQISPIQVQEPPGLRSDSVNNDDISTTTRASLGTQADLVPVPDPGLILGSAVSDEIMAEQETHDVRLQQKTMRSNVTGRRIRVKLPSSSADQCSWFEHPSKQATANESLSGSPKPAPASGEGVVPAMSYRDSLLSNKGPSTPPRRRPMKTGSTSAWKDFDPTASKNITSSMSLLAHADNSINDVVDSTNRGDLKHDPSGPGSLGVSSQVSAFNELRLEPLQSKHTDSTTSTETHRPAGETDTLTELYKPKSNPNNFSILAEEAGVASTYASTGRETLPLDIETFIAEAGIAPDDTVILDELRWELLHPKRPVDATTSTEAHRPNDETDTLMEHELCGKPFDDLQREKLKKNHNYFSILAEEGEVTSTAGFTDIEPPFQDIEAVTEGETETEPDDTAVTRLCHEDGIENRIEEDGNEKGNEEDGSEEKESEEDGNEQEEGEEDESQEDESDESMSEKDESEKDGSEEETSGEDTSEDDENKEDGIEEDNSEELPKPFLFTGQNPPPSEQLYERLESPREFKFEMRSSPKEPPARPGNDTSDARRSTTGSRASPAMLRAAGLMPPARRSLPARATINPYRRRPLNPRYLVYYEQRQETESQRHMADCSLGPEDDDRNQICRHLVPMPLGATKDSKGLSVYRFESLAGVNQVFVSADGLSVKDPKKLTCTCDHVSCAGKKAKNRYRIHDPVPYVTWFACLFAQTLLGEPLDHIVIRALQSGLGCVHSIICESLLIERGKSFYP